MNPLRALLRWVAFGIDLLNEGVGRLVALTTVVMVIVQFLVVVLRYGFDIGSIPLQESVMYLYAYLFMLGAAYTLKHDGHVRVDIFYARMSKRSQAVVDLLGSLFLLIPTFAFVLYSSWTYVLVSWARREGSPEAGGIPFVYGLKTAILLLGILMLLQGLAQAIKAVLVLLGREQMLQHTREGQENV
jgi:TRAP-type mannitol/chloroaromatic compound transport system permease small subunit